MARKPPRLPLPEGRAPQPRHEPKKPSEPTSTKRPRFDGTTKLSVGVPDDVKTAMARVIMAHSHMDITLEYVIWDLTGLTYDDGRLLTTIDVSEKIRIAKALVKRYGLSVPKVPANTPGLWKVMEDVTTLRNRMAHGLWQMYALRAPVVSSFRLNDEKPNVVVHEAFPIERMEAIARQCDWVRNHLQMMLNAAVALRRKLAQQRRKG